MNKLLLSLVLTSLVLPLSAQDDALTWTPEYVMKFRGVTQTALSPDGSHLAYVVRTPVMEGD